MSKNATIHNKILLSTFAIALAAVAAGCSTNGEDLVSSSSLADLSGNWTVAADRSAPPTVTNCTGDLVNASPGLEPEFGVRVTQSGVTFDGGGTMPCGGQLVAVDSSNGPGGPVSVDAQSSTCNLLSFALGGVVNGMDVSGQLSVSSGPATLRASFDGSVSGDVASLSPTTLTVDGMNGSCTVTGSYDLTR